MLNKMKNLVKAEEGQGMTEYGLVLGIIAIGAIVAVVALKDQILALFGGVTSDLQANTPNNTTP